MELFRIRRDLPFMKYALVLNAISFITFAAAVFFLATRGLHFSIDFTGGTTVNVHYAQSADVEKVRKAVASLGYEDVQAQNFGSSHDVQIRVQNRPGVNQLQLVDQMFAKLCTTEGGEASHQDSVTPQGESVSKRVCMAGGAEPLQFQSSDAVGPSIGAELAQDGLKALAFVVVGIVIYLAIRFEWKFGVAGIIANLHDVVIILGFFAFFQWEFSPTVLAAVLAVLGYSVNESVVIFDRVREAFRRFRKMNTHEVIDHAITSTISRTIITHGCTQLVVLSMLIFGGQTLHYFAIALTIGICFGIYSSVFVAAAIAMWLGVKREDLIKLPVNKDDPDDPNAGAVV
ncbi:protein translocase subunit SecF [Pelomonas sp. KK5]|uniref:protein translocase subunit SecF n=1 Tax=Pelomonas sp. KK5 TaxID=1855730 RepID=UPI00097C1F72|nr:protein translocase subunit SecF [Pelomonas sp. KK5]